MFSTFLPFFTGPNMIALVGVLYALTVVAFCMSKDYPMAIMFTGYTIGQVGIYMLAVR